MAESRVMMARKRSGFATAEALFNDLEKTAASKRRPLPGSSHYA
jgi:hypothetical protein